MARRKQRLGHLVDAWHDAGLKLPYYESVLKAGLDAAGEGKKWGNSFDAQRLIFFARQQGREDAMIEEVYKANHEEDRALSDWSVLLPAAERAGITGAEEMLRSDRGVREVAEKIDSYRAMGINAVPVIIINERHLISNGAPEPELLTQVFNEFIAASNNSASAL